MKKVKVSLIIPVYNAEQYICRCIEHCINQSFENIEIIIVDDNSSDNSPKKISEYANIDCRIKYLRHDYNAGVSVARNHALNIATGEYVVFVDSDDYLQNDAIENLIKTIKKQDADLIIGSWQKTRFGVVVEKKVYKDMKIGEEDVRSSFALLDACLSTVWGKLYKLDIINSINLRFNEEMFIAEDHFLNLQYLLHCKLIKLSGQILYNYSLGGNLSTVKYQDNFNISYRNLLYGYKSVMDKFKIDISLSRYAAVFFSESTQHYLLHSDKCNLLHKLDETYTIFKPYISQHNFAVLREIGYKNKEILSLREEKLYQYLCWYKRRRFIHILVRKILIFLRMNNIKKIF